MKRVRGITLVETLISIGIIFILTAAIVLCVGPSMRAAGSQRVCAGNLRQIGAAERVYMADNDGMYAAWSSRQMRPYLKVRPSALYCPKAQATSKAWNGEIVRLGSYRDQMSWHQALLNPKSMTKKEPLPNGLIAPDFDVERDAILKCVMHGSQGFIESKDMHGFWISPANIRGKVLSLYLDGHVEPAHIIGCWEVPYYIDDLVYRRHPELIPVCDGKLGTPL